MMFKYPTPVERNAIIEAEMGYRLHQADQRVYDNGTKETLLVNKPGRKVERLHFFCPSLQNPEPFGYAPGGLKASVHKKVGKKPTSRRGRK